MPKETKKQVPLRMFQSMIDDLDKIAEETVRTRNELIEFFCKQGITNSNKEGAKPSKTKNEL